MCDGGRGVDMPTATAVGATSLWNDKCRFIVPPCVLREVHLPRDRGRSRE